MAEWAESLAAISFESALQAVREYRDLGHPAPPTPGQVYAGARGIEERAKEGFLSGLKRLPMAKPSEEEKARVRKLLADVGVSIKTI